MKCLYLLIEVSLVSWGVLASPGPARKLAVAGVDNDALTIKIFQGGAGCGTCVTGPGVVSPCLGGAWPPGCGTTTTCLDYCQTGYSFWCPESCAFADFFGFGLTSWKDADYSKNNNDVYVSGALNGVSGLTCEQSEFVTDPTKYGAQLAFGECVGNTLKGTLCPESCDKMYDMETCAGTDSATFTDQQSGGTCSDWHGHCSKQNEREPGVVDAYTSNCALFDTSNWNFGEDEGISDECEEGGFIAGSRNYYTKETMDAVRENCPVACYTCHDNKNMEDDSSSSSNPCFGREMQACLLTENLPAASAFDMCFGGNTGDGASRVFLSELRSGDLVLDSATSASRVIVNQHVHSPHTSTLLTIGTAEGTLVVTPDHYIATATGFAAAGKADTLIGASGTVAVKQTGVKTGKVVNPITVTGKILVATAEGAPFLATTYGGWIAETALRFGGVLTSVSLSNGLSFVFPVSAQAYHDAVIEPIAPSKTAFSLWSQLFTATPSVFHPIAFFVLDLAVAAGFTAWAMCSVGGAAVAAAAVFKLSARK